MTKPTTQSLIESHTVEIHGRGSEPYKWVSRLTPAERAHVINGGTVLIRDEDAHHYNQCGWKQVIRSPLGRWFHREATSEQIASLTKVAA